MTRNYYLYNMLKANYDDVPSILYYKSTIILYRALLAESSLKCHSFPCGGGGGTVEDLEDEEYIGRIGMWNTRTKEREKPKES